MPKTIQSLRLLAAPAAAVLLMVDTLYPGGASFRPEQRTASDAPDGCRCGRDSCRRPPWGLVFLALVLPSLKVLPSVLLSGVLSYSASFRWSSSSQ